MKAKLPHSSQLLSLLAGVRAVRAKDAMTLAAVIGIVATLEVFGRLHNSELVDVASSCVLALTLASCVAWHRRWNLGWTSWLVGAARAVSERLVSWKFDWGLDLRRTPVLPRGVPPVMIGLPLVLAAGASSLLLWHGLIGWTLRSCVTQISYVAYIAGLSATWLALAFVVLSMVVAPSWLLSDLLTTYTSWSSSTVQRATWLARASFFVVVLLLSMLLPTWAATLLLALNVAVAVVVPWLPPAWHPDCLWRTPLTGEIRSVSLGTMLSLQLVIVALAPAVPIFLALGGEAIGRPVVVDEVPLSLAMGRVAIWLASCGMFVLFGLLGGHMFVSRWHDPARLAPLTLHVSGPVDAPTKVRWRREFAERSWRLRFAPASAARTDVCVVLDENSTQRSRSAISCAISDFDDPEFLFRVARRDQVQRRRLLVHGLETIFRRAARKRRRAGCGYWVAPHYWFVDGLTRDETTDDETALLEVIPPLYQRAIPRPARRHFFEIARALEIDLLFVEDGVGLRGLRSVLRVLFERYDIDGGRERLREIHFAGLPKMRVIIHDYTLDQPWTHTNYPEPDYRHLGRVRILHVFRDRGGEEELAESPEDPDWILSPVGST